MKILGIETSCDETALCVIEANGDIKKPESLSFKVLANQILSQINIHAQYGGVFPAIAKREHSKALFPLLEHVLKEYDKKTNKIQIDSNKKEEIRKILAREPELCEDFLNKIETLKKPELDAIAVTYGPGLEPTLWVGINFAKALSLVWDIPVIPTNHMEGHIVSSLTNKINWGNSVIQEENKTEIVFPAIALLISGGHTELVLVEEWTKYKIIGKTLDDAIGEAFDKVARLLGLPYPGGPAISKLAQEARLSETPKESFNLPRPMLHSQNLDFSFSGLKTAVLYTIKKIELTEENKKQMAREFEDAVTEVLLYKTKKAVKEFGAKSIIIGGGVSANKHIRQTFDTWAKKDGLNLSIPNFILSTDNAVMIAIAGYIQSKETRDITLEALGNLTLS